MEIAEEELSVDGKEQAPEASVPNRPVARPPASVCGARSGAHGGPSLSPA